MGLTARVRVDLARDGVQSLRRVLSAAILAETVVRASLGLQHLEHSLRRLFAQARDILRLGPERLGTERKHEPRDALDGTEKRSR